MPGKKQILWIAAIAIVAVFAYRFASTKIDALPSL